MPATLTATKNPVGVWGETGTSTTTINWDTGSAQRGRVYIMVATPPNVPLNETLFAGNPATGDRNGSNVLPVKFGSTYTLILRQANNNAALATLVVTVVDAQQQSVAQAAAAAILMQSMNPPQAIYSLSVQAGIDTVRVSFSTVQPTIPAIRVEAQDGTLVASALAIFGGLRTDHHALMGGASPLDQGTQFNVTIIASGLDYRGHPHDAVATTQFTTGTRNAQIFFQAINVRKDGDPGIKGAGDFDFTFGAGDAAGRSNLGEPWPSYSASISDDDPPVSINEKIDIDLAPRSLWVQVIGTDDDFSIFSGGGGWLGTRPAFDGSVGSGWASTNTKDQSYVTGVFDISDAVYGTTIPMELSTGNFDVAFTVSGLIFVQTTPGISPFIFPFTNVIGTARGRAMLTTTGKGAFFPQDGFAGGGGKQSGGKRGISLGRGADGTVYRKIVDGERRQQQRDEGWIAAIPAVAGAVTAVATAAGRVALFALDAEGVVLRAEIANDQSGGERPAKWQKLGGRFTGAVTAEALATSVELLASDDSGAAFHLTLPVKGGKPESDWRRIGEGLQGGLQTVSLGKDTLAVFALGRRGEVMHKIYSNGHWRKEGWQAISGASGVLLGAASAGSESIESNSMGVALAVIGEDLNLHTLLWRDYPAKKPERWVSHGDFQSWLVRPMKAKPAPQRSQSKPASRRRSR